MYAYELVKPGYQRTDSEACSRCRSQLAIVDTQDATVALYKREDDWLGDHDGVGIAIMEESHVFGDHVSGRV